VIFYVEVVVVLVCLVCELCWFGVCVGFVFKFVMVVEFFLDLLFEVDMFFVMIVEFGFGG